MILDAALLNFQYYKVQFKGEEELPPLYLGVVANKKRAFRLFSTTYFTCGVVAKIVDSSIELSKLEFLSRC